jgi:hypothetical protein
MLAIIAGLFIVAVWDIGTQHGALTRPAAATVAPTFRALGLL